MRSQAPQRVVEARFHRSDRAVHDLGDLGEVQAVHVMEDDDDPMLRTQRVDGGEHRSSQLRLFRERRR